MIPGNILEYVQSFVIMRDLYRAEILDVEADRVPADEAGDLIVARVKQVKAIENQILDCLEDAFGGQEPVAPQPSLKEQLGLVSRPETIRLVGETAQADITYEQFRDVFAAYGVPPAAGMQTWFRDVGGWDKSTAKDRLEIYERLKEYYAKKQQEAASDDRHDVNNCYACGKPGVYHERGEFYTCADSRCGFQGRDGKFRGSSWDTQNHEEKLARLRSGGGARGRR